jgi:hypothetical protein
MAGRTRVESKVAQFKRNTSDAVELMLAKMRNDAFVLSQAKVPYKEGDLSASGKQERRKRHSHRVSYGESLRDPRASYQERGRRKDGSHVVRKYTTAGTGKDFLKDAANNVLSRSSQYAKQAMGRVKV